MLKRKILLLEDDKLFSETLQEYLEEKGFVVEIAYDGEEALNKTYYNNYDIYLLDINVPEVNGLDFLKLIRSSADEKPAIFITSHTDKETLIDGYKSGCDDYMRKPIDLEELYYRIKVLLKKSNHQLIFKLNDECIYDMDKREVICNEKRVNLSVKVINLLELFLENRGKVVTKEQIISRLWSINETYSDGSIRVYINKLKKILGKEKIKNIKGIGYKITDS